jgi:hypothetical protein
MSDRAKFAIVAGLSLALGVVGLFCPDVTVRGFGEALFIAGFLAVTVDVFVKQRLAREVSQDVMAATLGIHVPPEIREEIREIASFKIIRRNVDIVYRISDYPASPDYVWVNSELQFDVENLTDSSQPFKHLIWVERPFHFEGSPLRQILYAKAVKIEPGQEYELQEKELVEAEVKDEHAMEWSRVASIPPRATARYWSHFRQILPVEHVDTFLLIQPSIGIRVRAYIEADLKVDLQVSVQFAHRKNDQKQSGGGNSWELNAGFPPHSTATIEWRKRSSVVPAPAPMVPAAPTPAVPVSTVSP